MEGSQAGAMPFSYYVLRVLRADRKTERLFAAVTYISL